MTGLAIAHPDGIFCMGRQVPTIQRRAFHFGDYLTFKYATPPTSRDWTPKAMPSLGLIYENASIGDCVIACGAHCEGVLTGNSRDEPLLYTRDQIIKEYGAIGGYVDGDPQTDKGCNMTVALDYWQQSGFAGGTKVGGWMKVNATRLIEVRAAINEFGFLFGGICLPNAWVAESAVILPGVVWDVAGDPNPRHGHCIGFCGYDADTVFVSTWGMVLRMTNAALAKYLSESSQGELYTVITQDWLDDAKLLSPPGLDWSQLTADAYSMR